MCKEEAYVKDQGYYMYRMLTYRRNCSINSFRQLQNNQYQPNLLNL